MEAGHEGCSEAYREDEHFVVHADSVAHEYFAVVREDFAVDRVFGVTYVAQWEAYERLEEVDVVLAINALDHAVVVHGVPEYAKSCMDYVAMVKVLDSVMAVPWDSGLAVAPSDYFEVMVKPSLFNLSNHY